MSERNFITRRDFLAVTGSSVLSLILAACGVPNPPVVATKILPVPPEVKGFRPVIIKEIKDISEFKDLPAEERIKYIESTDKKVWIDNEQEEYARAVADYFCKQTGKTETETSEIAGSIHFAQPPEYDEAFRAEMERTNVYVANPQGTLGFSARDKKSGIWLNSQVIDKFTTSIISSDPETMKIMDTTHKLPRWFLIRSVILHEIAHYGGKSVDYDFSAKPLLISNEKDQIDYKFIKIENKNVFGFQKAKGESRSKEKYALTGEAMTELVSAILSDRIDTLSLPNAPYNEGAVILHQICQAAKISEDDMIAYSQGNKPLSGMFDRWAKLKDPNNTSQNEAIMAYTLVGLVVSGNVSATDAVKLINQSLNINISASLTESFYVCNLTPHPFKLINFAQNYA